MARPPGDYGSEIKSSMTNPVKRKGPPQRGAAKPDPDASKDTPADMARDRVRGIPEDSPQDRAIDVRAMPRQPMNTAVPPDAHHVAAAASIAHAILSRGQGGGMM